MDKALRQRILPVLDLKDGQVVRGIAGRRDEYRPVVSRWTDSSEPLAVAKALRLAFGFVQFYVADLGAICDRRPHDQAIDRLLAAGFELVLDAGIRSDSDCRASLARPGVTAVIGLESIGSPDCFRATLAQLNVEHSAFSLDLMNEQPVASADWPESPVDIVATAVEAGFRRLIVLDLAAVGTGAGCPTLPLCREARRRYPAIEIITGGGVRSEADVAAAVDAGADLVLVASALHDGRIN